jgi:hypothetical protein
MDLPTVKYSGGKTVPHSYLWVGTTLGDQRQKDNKFKVLQWNADGLNHIKKIYRSVKNKTAAKYINSFGMLSHVYTTPISEQFP